MLCAAVLPCCRLLLERAVPQFFKGLENLPARHKRDTDSTWWADRVTDAALARLRQLATLEVEFYRFALGVFDRLYKEKVQLYQGTEDD